jgi:hypothetical protein
MLEKTKFSKADHVFSCPFSSLTRCTVWTAKPPLQDHCLSRFSNITAPALPLPGLYLASQSRGLAQWMQLLDIAEKVPTASPKDGFLANFIR